MPQDKIPSGFELRFGRRIDVPEVKALTGSSESSIYRHYQQFGGIRIGRKIMFFEQKLIEALENVYANQADNRRQDDLEGSNNPSGREEDGKDLRNTKGGRGVGSGSQKGDAGYIRSRHGLW